MEDVKNRSQAIDENDTDSGNEVVVAPKKRGRPAKLNKPPPKPPSGRGRGRPPKNAKKKNDDSDGVTLTNGEKRSPGKRGRPPKSAGKPKVTNQSVDARRGRGRPREAAPSDVKESDDNENASDES